LGLALSGGGHRAAFFHIGALAKLGELGLLRRVEVLSTVATVGVRARMVLPYVSSERARGTDVLHSRASAYVKMVKPTYSRTDRAGASGVAHLVPLRL
jgi:hypothetical protein